MSEIIEIHNWDGVVLTVSKHEYIRKFTEKLGFLELLVNYDDAGSENRKGTEYYLESKSEDDRSKVFELVSSMAENEFVRIYKSQLKESK